MKKIFDQLAKKIITKEDLIFFIEEVNILQSFIFKNTRIPLSDRLNKKVEEDFKQYIKELEDQNLLSGSPNQQLSFFEDLKDYLQKIPQLKLEIAFSPPRSFLLAIKKWFREKNGQEVILDITVNPEIVGGATIEYQGRYRDFSLLEKLNKSISQIRL